MLMAYLQPNLNNLELEKFVTRGKADNERMLRLLRTRVQILERKLEEGVVALTFAPRGDGPPDGSPLTREPR